MYKIRVFDRGFWPRSPSPVWGFWKSPRAARRALGDFQNPLRAPGIWVKIPFQKPEFSIYISISKELVFLHITHMLHMM